MSADQLLEIARREKPHVTYTRNKAGTAIAAWKDGRWHTVAGKTIIDKPEWVTVGDLLINGEPVNRQEDWLPV